MNYPLQHHCSKQRCWVSKYSVSAIYACVLC